MSERINKMGTKNRQDKKKKNAKKNNDKKKAALVSIGGEAPTYTKQPNVQDFLDETTMDEREKYGCVTFAAPGETMIEEFKEQIATELDVSVELVSKIVDAFTKREHPKRAFKYVGGRPTVPDCKDRIAEVMEAEPEFHIYASENGKWCTFDPSPELIKDENYREQQLNEIIKSKKLGEQRSKEFFRSEMRKKVERARIEGTKEGQQILLEAEEPFEAVKFRAESSAKNIEEYREKIVEMERTRALAEQKLEKMRAEGKEGSCGSEDKNKIEEKLAQLGETMQFDDEADVETKKKLAQLNEIERNKIFPENIGKATMEHLQKTQQQQQPPQPPRVFEDDVMIPSRDYHEK